MKFCLALAMRRYRGERAIFRELVQRHASMSGASEVNQSSSATSLDAYVVNAAGSDCGDSGSEQQHSPEENIDFEILDVEKGGHPTNESSLDYTDDEDVSIDQVLEATAAENSSAKLDTLPSVNWKSEELTKWALKGSAVPRDKLTSLLKLLREKFGIEGLPLDARTLLKTPVNVDVEDMCDGDYVYLGIAKGLQRLTLTHPNLFMSCLDLPLQFNMDGLPPFDSSPLSVWPILGKYLNHVFLVAVWTGKSKDPSDPDLFMKDFLVELEQLRSSGVELDGKIIPLRVDCFVNDAPARSMCKGTKLHSGYSSCERCVVKGARVENRICYPHLDAPLRSDEGLSKMEYRAEDNKTTHQLRRKSLIDHNIGCVSMFVLDSMHLVYQGVVKRLLEWLTSSSMPRQYRLSQLLQDMVSEHLLRYNGKLPREFA